jgi:hypothetical protein
MLLSPPSLIKHHPLLFLSLSRVLDGTESDEGLVSEAVRVVGGDAAAPVAGMGLLLGSNTDIVGIDISINPASK